MDYDKVTSNCKDAYGLKKHAMDFLNYKNDSLWIVKFYPFKS